jgi:hypothetical protein
MTKQSEVSGSHGESEIRRLDTMSGHRAVPSHTNIDDRRGNLSVTAGVYLFTKPAPGSPTPVSSR